MKLVKNNQHGRSLLSKYGADEQIFSSNVYKQNTRARKCQSDAPQYGRSMVEMLGVLAIIGVLSVGAIAGYSKAMFKQKINKTVNEISHMVASIRTAFNGKYEELDSDNIDLMKNLNIVPENMWHENNLSSTFGGNISIYGISESNYISFAINYMNLSSDACIQLASQNWSYDNGFLLVGACGYYACDSAYIGDTIRDGTEQEFPTDEGDAYTPYWQGSMSLKTATLGCTCPDNECSIMLGFK